MSDILPKLKTFIFITIMMVLINMSLWICKQSTDIGLFIASIGTSFIPFVSLIVLFVYPVGLPIEFIAFASVIVVIFSSVQTVLIAMFILQTVSNLLWHPDV